jgi:NAD(P)-dependent dehydrogenase (short-subunit alcohol dehydrogenase family)
MPQSISRISRKQALEDGNKTLQELRGETLGATNIVELLQIDLSSDGSIEKAFRVVKKRPDRLNILINNAGKDVVLDLYCCVIENFQAAASTLSFYIAVCPCESASTEPTT